MIRFLCPYGHKLVVPDHRAGKKGRCPTCQQKVLIPDGSARPAGPGRSALLAGPDGPIRPEPDPHALLGFSDDPRPLSDADS